MPNEDKALYCLDSNIFLAVMLPEATKAPKEEIQGAASVLQALEAGRISAVTSVMALAEIRWVFSREERDGFDIAKATLEGGFEDRLTLLTVDADIAVASARFRSRYYSRTNPFSYNDGIFLATALRARAWALITTDRHLLSVSEIRAIRPSQFTAKLRSKTSPIL